MSLAAGAAHIACMATHLTSIREAPASSEPDPGEPYEFDNRAFTPEAMDEHTEWLLASAVGTLAA
jgi:hypothetical protein